MPTCYILYRCSICWILYAVEDRDYHFTQEQKARFAYEECGHCRSGDVEPLGKIELMPG